MKKYLRVINNFIVYDVPLEFVAEKRAEAVALAESKVGTKEFNMLFSEEYQHGMDEDEVISSWAKEHLTWDKIMVHAIKMDVMKKDETVIEFKDSISVVFH